MGHCPAPSTGGYPQQDCAGSRRRARHSRTPVAKRQARDGRSQRTAFAIVRRPRPVPQKVAPRRVAGARKFRRPVSRSPREFCEQWPAAEPAGRPARSDATPQPACPPLRDQTTPRIAGCRSGAVPIPARHVSAEMSATLHIGPGSRCERDRPATTRTERPSITLPASVIHAECRAIRRPRENPSGAQFRRGLPVGHRHAGAKHGCSRRLPLGAPLTLDRQQRPERCQSSCGFDCFETAVTFADIWDAAIMFLYCRMRLVGIIGYHLTVSLPPQPTRPKSGFSSSPSISAECSGPATASGCGAPPDTQIATSTSTTQCWQCVSSAPPLRQA